MGTNYLKGKLLEDFSKLRPGYGYGLGVRVHIDKEKSGSISSLGEFGWDGAAGAYVLIDPDNYVGIFYATHVCGHGKYLFNKFHGKLRDEVYRVIFS